jgi:hypothetical protein
MPGRRSRSEWQRLPASACANRQRRKSTRKPVKKPVNPDLDLARAKASAVRLRRSGVEEKD